jgi:outer membrane protein assembly factor BamB
MIQRSAPLVLPLALSLLLPAAAADWPQWRGPNRDGHSADANLLTQWPAGGPKLLWKTSGLGTGYSSVAVAGGRIITMGDLKDASFIIALDLDGKELWRAKVGKTGGNYAGTRCTPTIDGGLVYGLGQFGDLVCVEAKTGKERWRHNVDDELKGQVGGWNYSESPLVDGDRLVCAPGGRRGTVAAFDKQSGKLLWQTKDYTDSAEYTSIVAATIAGKKQYVHLSGDTLTGIDPESGAVLWKTERRGATATVPTPIVDGDRIYVTSGYGVGCNLFEVEKQGGDFKVTEVYKSKDMVNHHGGVVKVGPHLYGYSDGKGWVCQELATGKTVWREKQKLGKGSIAYADGKLFLRQEDGKGTVVLIEATPKGWVELGRFDQPNRSNQNSWAHPVVCGGRLYLRDMDVLLAYDVGGKSSK